MGKEDLDVVYNIERKTFPNPFNQTLIRSIFFHNPHLCLIIEINTKVIGFVLGGKTSHTNQNHILSFAILKDYQGKGYGSELLRKYIDLSKMFGYESIILEVRIDNQQAIKLYEKFKFKKTHTIRKYYEDKCDAYVYVLNIRN